MAVTLQSRRKPGLAKDLLDLLDLATRRCSYHSIHSDYLKTYGRKPSLPPGATLVFTAAIAGYDSAFLLITPQF
eukprot:SAG25_NODE_1195_length_3647_cov_3.030722_2_plen_74_part_00